jgi:hypothetical protein
MDKIDKLIEEQGDMKVELARLDGDIKSLKDAVLPLRGLEIGYQKLKSDLAANDTKIENIKLEIAKDIKDIKDGLKLIPKLQEFKLTVQVAVSVALAIIGMGFTFVGFVMKNLNEINHAIAGMVGN